MYHLFKDRPQDFSGGMIIQDFPRIRAGLQFSLAKVIDFRRHNPRTLDASHLLVRLLQNLNVPLSLEPIVYADRVSDIALNLAMSLRMTSPLSKGRVFTPGVFYGQNVTEVLLANIEPFDVESPWREWRPIKVLYHPQSDLNMHVPDGRHASLEAGMAVISINIPMLAAQYRAWRMEENTIDRSNPESPRSIMQFLQLYPLPNMLYSHLDIALLNRLISRYFEVKMPVIPSQHSFYLSDWTMYVDRTMDRFLRLAVAKRWDFDTLIGNIPTVSALDLHDVIRVPDMVFTHQVQWAVVLARLPLVIFLVQMNAAVDNPRNQPYLNYLRLYLRSMDLNQTMRTALPRSRFEDVMTLIDHAVVPYL